MTDFDQSLNKIPVQEKVVHAAYYPQRQRRVSGRRVVIPFGKTVSLIERRLCLNRDLNQFSICLDTQQPSTIHLALTMRGINTDWARISAESAVLMVYVDGRYSQDIVVWSGKNRHVYGLDLGSLEQGEHNITLSFSGDKSPKLAKGLIIEYGTATSINYRDELNRVVYENSPILFGRVDLENNHTDTPLAMFYAVEVDDQRHKQITYTYVYSNEDGGSGVNLSRMQAMIGREADIEPAYRITIDDQRSVIKKELQGDKPNRHTWRAFNGQSSGAHPVLRVATINNLVDDQGASILKFRLLPDLRKDQQVDDLLRTQVEWWPIIVKELRRENKIDWKGDGAPPNKLDEAATTAVETGKWAPLKMADPRRYIYLQFQCQNLEHIFARVLLKNGKTYDSNAGCSDALIHESNDGRTWHQTAVLLPRGTKFKDVVRIEFNNGTRPATNITQGQHYMLNSHFEPTN